MRIIRLEETDSTNLDARRGQVGDVFWAEFQRAGRGRLDHTWQAARGANLTFSAVLSDGGRDAGEIATLPLVVGLAVLRGVSRFAPALAASLRLKWPNDLLADGRKLAGILCERHGERVIAGIGLNVNQTAFPPEIAARATSLALLTGAEHDRRALLSAVLDALTACCGVWRREGFAALHPALAAVDFLKGKDVSIWQTDTDAAPLTGVCDGIRPDGTLSVGGVPVFAGEAHVGFSRP
jgi:BirA family biotin operon repressor/biotin-[acetyl-CoA-carboxylase] ligase